MLIVECGIINLARMKTEFKVSSVSLSKRQIKHVAIIKLKLRAAQYKSSLTARLRNTQ